MSSLVKQEQQKEDVYSKFVNCIKSDGTKKVYEYNLGYLWNSADKQI